MSTGTVVSFDAARGCGFIHPAQGGRDVCALLSDIERARVTPLHPGQTIDYDLTWNRAGTLLAINLRLRSVPPP
jgi:CspA family cold shock protein